MRYYLPRRLLEPPIRNALVLAILGRFKTLTSLITPGCAELLLYSSHILGRFSAAFFSDTCNSDGVSVSVHLQ